MSNQKLKRDYKKKSRGDGETILNVNVFTSLFQLEEVSLALSPLFS